MVRSAGILWPAIYIQRGLFPASLEGFLDLGLSFLEERLRPSLFRTNYGTPSGHGGAAPRKMGRDREGGREREPSKIE